MIYEHVLKAGGDRVARTALIGTGMFGTSLLAQARMVPRMELRVVCDRSAAALEKACRDAGIPAGETESCATTAQARAALERGRVALLSDSSLVAELPVDIVVECTGDAEAGARHGEAAILAGKHVAMVTKETDAVVGPFLHALAAERGVVYTPVDGDQHGLLAGLHGWARTLGFRVLCGGKARESDYVFDEALRTVTNGHKTITLASSDRRLLARASGASMPEIMAARKRALRDLPLLLPADVCEMVIGANHTGLVPDRPELHAPVLRFVEVPEVLCPQSEGGILTGAGVIDLFTCLRRADEPGMMGGVFLVIESSNRYSREWLGAKGMPTNSSGTAALVYRPLHMLGVEAPISVLCAVFASISTGSPDVKPRADLVGRARRPLSAGSVLSFEDLERGAVLEPLMVAAAPAQGGAPLPLYMAAGLRLARPVAAGATLAAADVEPPQGSRLWALRREQDRRFFA